MHELIFLHVGGAGSHVGLELWELLAREHLVGPDGKIIPEVDVVENNNIGSVFDENSEGIYSSRSLFVDSDPEVLDSLGISTSPYSKIHKKDNLIRGKECSASNYSRAKYNTYREKSEDIENRLRIMLERCDSPQGVMMTHSLSGGTGSGWGEALCSKLVNEMKISTSTFSVLPCSKYANEIVAHYNVLLAISAIREAVDASFFFDNTSLYNLCQKHGMENPQYEDINHLIAQGISSITSSQRFGINSGKSMKSIYEHLVPFKRINLISNHFSDWTEIGKYNPSELVSPSNRMNNIDLASGKTLALNVSWRGPGFSLRNIIDTSSYFRSPDGSLIFSKYVQTSINSSLSKTPITNNAFKFSNTAHVAHNTTAIMNSFTEIRKAYEPSYARRAFCHWFVGEGMESGEFPMVLYNFDEMKSDYDELDENAQPSTKDESED